LFPGLLTLAARLTAGLSALLALLAAGLLIAALLALSSLLTLGARKGALPALLTLPATGLTAGLPALLALLARLSALLAATLLTGLLCRIGVRGASLKIELLALQHLVELADRAIQLGVDRGEAFLVGLRAGRRCYRTTPLGLFAGVAVGDVPAQPIDLLAGAADRFFQRLQEILELFPLLLGEILLGLGLLIIPAGRVQRVFGFDELLDSRCQGSVALDRLLAWRSGQGAQREDRGDTYPGSEIAKRSDHRGGSRRNPIPGSS